MASGRSKTMMGRNEWDGKKIKKKREGVKDIQKLLAKNQRATLES